MNLKWLAGALATCVLLFSTGLSRAAPGQGDLIFVVDPAAEVVATFLSGQAAGNSNTLYLDSPFVLASPLFNNHTSAIGEQVNLGMFQAGTELVFRITSDSGSIDTWFTGPAARNSDNFAHAAVTDIGNQSVRVAFEDLVNGGDLNFDDMVFSLTNTSVVPVPEPGAYLLMIAGLALVTTIARRNASNQGRRRSRNAM